MRKHLLYLFILFNMNFISAQRYQKLGHGINPKTFFHQQNINYYLTCTDDKGKTYRIHYDTVSSSFSYGKEFTQIRLSVFDGISWLNTAPVRLYNKNTIDAPRVLDIKFYNQSIYICGSFDSSANDMGAGIIKYDGNWQSVGTRLYQKFPDYFEVNAMHVFGKDLLISGNFDSSDIGPAKGLLVFEENTWKTIGEPQKKGFQGLSGTSNVYFFGKDSLYAFNKNKILPDSIEIGGQIIKKLGVYRNGKFYQIEYPYPYISGLGSYQKQLVAIPCSQLLYINSIAIWKNNQWEAMELPDDDSFYTTNYMGSHEIDNLLYLFFQSPTEGIKIYVYNGQELHRRGQFKIAESYRNIEFRSQFGHVYISGNFTYIEDGEYLDSFNRIVKIDFVPSTRITGICFEDINGDGIRQMDELPVSGALITEKQTNYLAISDGKGRYNLDMLVTGDYKINAKTKGLQTKDDLEINDSKDSLYYTDLPMKPQVLQDVSVKVFCNTSNRVKQGFKTSYVIELTNFGSNSKNFQIKFNHAKGIDQKHFEQFTPDLVESDNWLEQVLLEGNSKKTLLFTCRYAVDSFELGSFVNVLIESNLNDDLKKNNQDTIRQQVVAAFDPNIKVAMPGVILEKNDLIKYTIHFENLGNDTALNVTVIDTIGSLLDISSLVFGGTSHKNFKFRVEKNCLIWSFEGIKLPPRKHDSVHCMGYVTLSTYVNQNAEIGDTIFNSAAIFFDYQKPVITNKAEVRYTFDNDNDDVSFQNLIIQPNPGAGKFSITGETSGQSEWILFDMQGKEVARVHPDTEGKFELSEALENGVYLLCSENGQLSERLVLIR